MPLDIRQVDPRELRRIAKLAPGVLVTVEVIDRLPINCGGYPKIGDRLP